MFDKMLMERQQKYLVENESLRGEIDRFNLSIRLEELDVETLSKIIRMIVMLRNIKDKT
jgi:hypothetical protein